MHRAHQPSGQGLLGREDVGGVHPLERLLKAHDARQEPGRRRFGDDAETTEDESDPGLGRREPDVHRQRHGRADPHRGTVDGGDHRLRQLVDRQRHLSARVTDPGLVGLLGQVVAEVLGRGIRFLVEPEDVALRGEVHAGIGLRPVLDRVVRVTVVQGGVVAAPLLCIEFQDVLGNRVGCDGPDRFPEARAGRELGAHLEPGACWELVLDIRGRVAVQGGWADLGAVVGAT